MKKHIPVTLANTPTPVTFKKPSKVKGRSKDHMHLKVEPAAKLVISKFAARVSKTSGITVSPANVLVTAFGQQWPEEAEKIRKLEKEAYGRKQHKRP